MAVPEHVEGREMLKVPNNIHFSLCNIWYFQIFFVSLHRNQETNNNLEPAATDKRQKIMTTTTINNSILKDLAFVKVSDPIVKAYTVNIVLHSPTQVIEKTIYAESVQEAMFDAAEMAKDWRENDKYFCHAYLLDGTTLIKRF